jgi:hypothetical protein
MNNFVLQGIVILFINFEIVHAQCEFTYLSNDTLYQDYIEFVSEDNNTSSIITIGSRYARRSQNDSLFNATVFQIFDECGTKQFTKVIRTIESFKIKHERLPFHHTYLQEPVGNITIQFNDKLFFIADKAIDTNLLKNVLILYTLDTKGNLVNYNTLTLSSGEANQNVVKNVIRLKNGQVLVVLWDNSYQYLFYYFDEKLNFKSLSSYNLGRGIRSIIEAENGGFYCSSLTYDKTSFQLYKLNVNGGITLLSTPFNQFGSIRDIGLYNNRIYCVGGVAASGVLMICDTIGTIVNLFQYDTAYCQQRFCSFSKDKDQFVYISGYLQHCDKSDQRGSDIFITKIDSIGYPSEYKLFNFKSDLGTSSDGDYYSDYGGFTTLKIKDGSIITNGKSLYRAQYSGVPLHEDAIIIKTKELLSGSTNNKSNYISSPFIIYNNHQFLSIQGPIETVKNWKISNLNGGIIYSGNALNSSIDISTLHSGIYFICLTDCRAQNYSVKFIIF